MYTPVNRTNVKNLSKHEIYPVRFLLVMKTTEPCTHKQTFACLPAYLFARLALLVCCVFLSLHFTNSNETKKKHATKFLFYLRLVRCFTLSISVSAHSLSLPNQLLSFTIAIPCFLFSEVVILRNAGLQIIPICNANHMVGMFSLSLSAVVLENHKIF